MSPGPDLEPDPRARPLNYERHLADHGNGGRWFHFSWGKALRVSGGVVLLVFGLRLTLWLTVPDERAIWRRKSFEICSSNVATIGAALRQYASEHDGRFPDDLDTLLAECYLKTPEVLVCPNGGEVPSPGAT